MIFMIPLPVFMPIPCNDDETGSGHASYLILTMVNCFLVRAQVPEFMEKQADSMLLKISESISGMSMVKNILDTIYYLMVKVILSNDL